MYLDKKIFQTIDQNTPLVSIDLIIRNAQEQVLLGRRNNCPAQGYWFVPGGRIRKNEGLAQAFERLTSTELDQEFLLDEACFLGVYEHLYADSIFNEHISIHYIVLAYELNIDQPLEALPLDQHYEYVWFNTDDLLKNTDVHENTKAYFL